MKALSILALATLCLVAACELPADTLDFDREEIARFKATNVEAPPANPARLKIMAWNVKYGAGRIDFWFDFWGDETQMTVEQVEGNMERIYELIRQYDPDVLITSEIEVNSKRSAYYDMVRGILENTKLNYATYVQTWNGRYVPSEGVGRIDLGNAIFSKYEITKAERIRQVDRTDQDPATSYFYIHRALGRAELDLGNRSMAVWAIHTEAYDNDGTKQKHIAQAHEELKKETLPWVIGGDFNELFPNALKLSGFPDEPASSIGTPYEQPPYTPEVMKPFFADFKPWITEAEYGDTEADQRRYFTHSVIGPEHTDNNGEPGFWNRTLDYLFAAPSLSWQPGQSDVLQAKGRMGITVEPVTISDHAPVVGTLQLEVTP